MNRNRLYGIGEPITARSMRGEIDAMKALVLVLSAFTLFSYKAPQGMKAMGALANAACATFLVEALQLSLLGNVFGIPFLAEIGTINGGFGGVAAGTLVMLALGVSPVYALMLGLTSAKLGILSDRVNSCA